MFVVVVVVVVRLAFVLKTAEECVENRVEYVPKPAVGWCHYCSFRAFQEQSCNPIGRNSARSVSVPGLPKGKVSTRGFAMWHLDWFDSQDQKSVRQNLFIAAEDYTYR
jgi:hypothetical protein